MTNSPDPGRRTLTVASSVRRRILDELLSIGPGAPGTDRPGRSAAEIGEILGLHVTTARFHLDRLCEAGVVEGFREVRRTVGRPRTLYAARFEAIPLGRPRAPLRELSDLLAEVWGRARAGEDPDAAAAGHAWALAYPLGVGAGPRASTPGCWLVKVEILAEVVARWGQCCTITLLDGGESVALDLGSRPFAAVAHQHPDLVRELHRGILAGILARLDEPDVDIEVEPIDAADGCRARLRTRTSLSVRVRTA